jgi:hypothetical protein
MELRGHVTPPELPCAGRGIRWSPGNTWRPRSCPEPGGGSQSRGDTWRPRSCHVPRGGCWSPSNTRRLRSCHVPGGGYHTTAPLPCPSMGSQVVVVPVTPPDNPRRMITRGRTGFRMVPDHFVLTVASSTPTPSPIPSSARNALAYPHWCATIEEEYGALISNGSWELVPRP